MNSSIRQLYIILSIGFIWLFMFYQPAKSADTNQTSVYTFKIDSKIGPAIWRTTKKAINEAQSLSADHIIVQINTYGGLVSSADSIRSKILDTPIPVYAFIKNNAASAGALISIACDSIYMSPAASIGAATVVNQSGEKMPDKYQSYMRATMRATAEAHGKDTVVRNSDTLISWHRDPRIAEGMVDARIKIPGITDSGKVITFTTQEAMQNSYCEGEANNIQDMLKKMNITQYQIERYRSSTLDSIIGFLINPAFQGVLIMLIIGGIYFELQSPGIGLPLAVAILAALLYFAPLYLEGLAQNWEILIFIIGLLLIALEIFVIPGFGIAGVSGIIALVAGLTFSMADTIIWKFEGGNINEIFKSLSIVIVSMLTSFLLSLYLGKKLFTARQFSGLALESVQDQDEGYIGVETKQRKLTGKIGITTTVLRPSGKVALEDEIYDAKSEIGFIDKDTPVKIVRYETGQLYVVKARKDEKPQ